MKKALVTGSLGFVGRHMCQHLQSEGFETTEIDVSEDALAFFQFGSSQTRYDLVVHAAAAAPHRKAIDTQLSNFSYNVMLDSAMFNWAMYTKQRHVVYLSSSAVYPAFLQNGTHLVSSADYDWRLTEGQTEPIEEPADVYGLTKLFGERLARTAMVAGVDVTIVRPFSGYGEDQSEDFPFRAFIERARRREDPFTIWGHAGQIRDWIHIDDIVKGIMALVEANVRMPVNLCTGTGTSMLDMVGLVTMFAGYNPIVQVDEAAPMGVFYRVGNPKLLNQFYRPTVSIDEGIKRALGRI